MKSPPVFSFLVAHFTLMLFALLPIWRANCGPSPTWLPMDDQLWTMVKYLPHEMEMNRYTMADMLRVHAGDVSQWVVIVTLGAAIGRLTYWLAWEKGQDPRGASHAR